MTKLVSIVTITYNNLSGLKLSASSIKNSNILAEDFDWIVIDGNSNDGTLEFLKGDKMVANFISNSDCGIYDAMNKGIKLCRGEYTIFLNSGDEFYDTDGLFPRLRSSNADVFYGGVCLSYPNKIINRAPNPPSYIMHSLPTRHQSIFYRTDVIREINYDLNYRISADYALTAKLYKMGYVFRFCSQPISKFAPGGISTMKPFLLIKDCIRVQSEILKVSKLFIFYSAVKRLLNVTINYLLYKIC